MKLSRIIASLKNALGLNPVENKRKLIFDKIKVEKLNIKNEITRYNARIDELITELGKAELRNIDDIINTLYINFEDKKEYENKLTRYEELEKYLNEEIEVEITEPKKEETKKK